MLSSRARWHALALLRRAVVAVVLLSVGLGLALGLGAPEPGIAVRSYAGAVGLVVWGCLLSAAFWNLTLSGRASRGEDRPRHSRPGSPQFLTDSTDPAVREHLDLERDLRLGRLTIGDFDLLLAARLRALAVARARRRDVPLSDLVLVGEERQPIVDRTAPGVQLAKVAELASQLEEMR